jgi:hypothetical protein
MNFKMKPLVAAILATGFGSANAATDFIQAAGASAFRGAAENLVVSYCNAGSTTKYLSGVVETNAGASKHSGDITRIICVSTNTTYGLNATLDFSYDSFGGSWKAFTVTNTSLSIPSVPALNQEPVRTVDITTCSGATTTVTINGGAVTQIAGCAETTPLTSGGFTSIGFTDTEPQLFFADSANRPGAGSNVAFPASLGASSVQVPLLGVTWAVGASKPLWLALEADQVSAGILPASCSSNIDESSQICAPYISKAQYRSIVQGNGDGDLHYDLVNLFVNTAPAGTLTLERRDQGSGTQAASNAYFMNVGCSTRSLTPIAASVAGGMVVNVQPSTALVQAGLNADVYGIGHMSADKCPTAGSTFTGTTVGSYGCLKLQGDNISTATAPKVNGSNLYPKSANVVTGFYDYASEEQMFVRSGANAAEARLATDLQTSTTAFTNNAGFFNLSPLTTAPLTVPTNGTYFRVGVATTTGTAGSHLGGSNMCQGLVDTF